MRPMSLQVPKFEFTLNINIPALSAYVAYLTDSTKLQARIDELTAKSEANTAKVQAAVDANTPAPV